ncbi:hypothetical protein [Cryptosporangium phraense]|uniref:WXG100 family type VII secretion target n=1 Tax=Cryptosporangium phraense TaxID=2593070 RepID=A0A545ARF0_9ACTN|nr:hypothetical protein [Cryptosporangium phraense]TQS43821.1 hypothetical protein FL583_17505 [Cryptosporangium phraense]
MTDGNTFLRPKEAADAARRLTAIADDLERKISGSVGRIRAIHGKGNAVWGGDEPGQKFVENYDKGGNGAASKTLEAATRYTDVFGDVGPLVSKAVQGTVDIDQALGDEIKKLTAQPVAPPPEI